MLMPIATRGKKGVVSVKDELKFVTHSACAVNEGGATAKRTTSCVFQKRQ